MGSSVRWVLIHALAIAWLWLSISAVTRASHVMHAVNTASTRVEQRYRTAYHFQPQKNWMNAPMFYKGFYHLFYQYNPYGAVWGNIVWGHVVSKDLIHWRSLDPAIVPSEWYDIKGCWSGSATLLPGDKPAILYTGWANSSKQLQSMVVPKDASDPLLREWVKIPQNPLLVPKFGINGSSFRDPTTGWLGLDGKWRIVVGNKRKHRGVALLYRSKDFVHWVKAKHPLHSSKFTGMWECPDFYPVPLSGNKGLDTSAIGHSLKHVLKVSLDDYKYEYYTVGTYLRDSDRYVPDNTSSDDENGLRYDYGKFYASKTFFDQNKQRRILWGWINESDSVSDDQSKGWSGVQAIPRTIWLDQATRARLLQWPVSEVEALRRKKTSKQNLHLRSGSVVEIAGVNAAQVDVEVSFDLPRAKIAEFEDEVGVNLTAQQLCSQLGSAARTVVGPFGLLVLASKDLNERTAVFFQIVRYRKQLKLLMCSDQSRSSLQSDVDKTTYGTFVKRLGSFKEKSLSLRVLVDHSIVESFGEGGKACITARAYPTLAIGKDAHLYAFNNGTSTVTASKLTAWEMASSNGGTLR
eukprot:PITA_27237